MAQRILLKSVLTAQSRSYCTRSLNISAISIQRQFNNNINNYTPTYQPRRFKSFQSTQPLFEESKAEAEAKAPQPEDADACPEYQNPLHHENPDRKKIMMDDYADGETPEMVSLPPLDDGSGNVIAAPHLHALADEIVGMSMLEVKELVDRVADHFGIEESDDDDMAGDAGADAAVEEVVEVKTIFDLKLTGFDAKSKIKVIKEVRAITGLGLKEAKELVEGAPKTVMKDIKMEEAEKLKEKLEAVGATVEIE